MARRPCAESLGRHADRAPLSINTVGVVGPGDMGHNVGRALREQADLRVITALAGRSATSCERAARANMEDVGDVTSLVREADLILSIMPPIQAAAFADAIAGAFDETGETTPFAECNPLAPENVPAIAAKFAANIPFIDAGIVGPPRSVGHGYQVLCERPERSPARSDQL